MTRDRYSLLLFLLFVIGGGLAIGFLTLPGEWYAALAKPPFNPPSWVFAPVWSVLYVMIAVAGWSVFRRDRLGRAMKLWCLQLLLNFLWSPIFFGAHWIGAALLIVVLMLAVILGFIAVAWRQHRPAAWLFVPYAAWVAFAAGLNGALLALN